MTIQDLLIFALIWIAIGVVLIIIGIFVLASYDAGHSDDTSLKDENIESREQIEELLHYFLEEEEKKNKDFRTFLVDYAREQLPKSTIKKIVNGSRKDHVTVEVIRLHEQGLDDDAIAKQLKKGVGEVKLILSLHAMR